MLNILATYIANKLYDYMHGLLFQILLAIPHRTPINTTIDALIY